MTQSCLLAIFAHPDDESFGSGGMLGKYAREGVDVHICIVTDGASGSYDPDVVQPEEAARLAEVRREELRCAVETLGGRLHTFNYRDSGMEGSPDNRHPSSLYQADLDRVTQDVLDLVCRLRPDVIVTHDPTGGYFHPDHIRVNHAVVRAWNALHDPATYPALRVADCSGWKPARLYYGVIARSDLKWLIRLMRLFGRDPRRFGRNGDIDMTQVGAPDEDIHVRIDVRGYAGVKQEAGGCHASQGGGAGQRGVAGFIMRRMQRYEYYMQAYPTPAIPHDDFFTGMRDTQARDR